MKIYLSGIANILKSVETIANCFLMFLLFLLFLVSSVVSRWHHSFCIHHPSAAERTGGWENDRENIGISPRHESERNLLVFMTHWGNACRKLEALREIPGCPCQHNPDRKMRMAAPRLGQATKQKLQVIETREMREGEGLGQPLRWSSLKNEIFYNTSGRWKGGIIQQQVFLSSFWNYRFSSGPES